MTDEPDDGRIMTTSLPADRISLFSNFDDEESWLVPVEDKSGDLSDWLEGAMKDFDKSALKKQKRRIQQQNNNTSGCGLIAEEDESAPEDKETFYDAETGFEDEKITKKPVTATPSPRGDVSKPSFLTSTPNPPKAASLSPRSRPASNASGKSEKRIPELTELERKAEEQERELQEMLMKTLSRPQSSASNAADISARSACSVRQSSTSPSFQDTNHSSISTSSSQEKKNIRRSRIPIPERNPFLPLSARKSSNGITTTGSHIPLPVGLRPGSSSNSETSSNPDQWGGTCF